jgi:putative tricarboxylic transport membrane protein
MATIRGFIMNRINVVLLFVLIAALCPIPVTPEAGAAEYPDKVMEFVVHSAAGGAGADAFVRNAARILNDEGIVKQKFYVSNRTGGGAAVAVNYLASRKGDPYVLMGWTTAPIVAILRNTTTVKDPMEITGICSLVNDPLLLCVRSDSKYKNLTDLVDDARNNPDKVRACISSPGGTEHFVVNRLEKATGVKFNVTSFPAACIVSLLGGHVDYSFESPAQAEQNVTAGKLRVLANAGETRSQFLPDARTLKEQGVNASFTQFRGVWGPPGMPDYAVKFWGQAFAKLSESKTYKDQVKKNYMEPAYIGPEQMRTFTAEYAKGLTADLKELEVYGGKKN